MATPSDGVFVHESAYVDEPCTIGAGTKIWHFCHILPHSVIGRDCILDRVVSDVNTTFGREVRIGADALKEDRNPAVIGWNNVIAPGTVLGSGCIVHPGLATERIPKQAGAGEVVR